MGIKILGIMGSPRKGNTEIMVFEVLEGAKSKGADTETINLRSMNIKLCNGCMECEGSAACVYDDDMREILKKVQEAKGIVIGSPTYFDNVPGTLKNFIDRTLPVYDLRKLRGKFLGIVAVGEDGNESINKVVDYIRTFGKMHEMVFVGSVTAIARAPGSVRENEETIQELRQLGANMYEVIKKSTEAKKG